jgi:Zn-dependent peptidase ImmA (M78 family)
MGGKKKACATMGDGRYGITLAFSDEISPDSGKYTSPYDDQPAVVIVNPNQPEFDRAVALTHELNHHIAWTREANSTFVSHTALEYHACQFMTILLNSPKLAEYFYLFAKKGA